MGRITVSLPDAIEAQLDAYAGEHGLSVSKVVTRSLEAFLHDSPDPGMPTDLVATQQFISQVLEQLEVVRHSFQQMAIAQYGPFAPLPELLTKPLPHPPWGHAPAEFEG